jgi:hypothetical protein
MTTVYRAIKSLIVVESKDGRRLVMTFETCGHQMSFPVGFFRNKEIPTNASGKQVYKCERCSEIYTPGSPDRPEPGGAA